MVARLVDLFDELMQGFGVVVEGHHYFVDVLEGDVLGVVDEGCSGKME
jgi:hypothetical protein